MIHALHISKKDRCFGNERCFALGCPWDAHERNMAELNLSLDSPTAGGYRLRMKAFGAPATWEVIVFKIGDFSKLSRVSVKTLRYYDELGLLKPAHVDHFTGYRFYSADQLPQLNRILAL